MPTESDSKTSSESQKPRGWLAKCGIPILSVRDRPGSPDRPNRPVMTKADSPKKRKRTSSASPGKRMAFQYSEPKAVDMPLPMAVRDQFDAALGDSDKIVGYTKAHEKLLQEESDRAWDLEARSLSRSMTLKEQDNEKKAARIIRAAREYERKVTFGNQASEAIPGPETLDMGGQFLTNKERINQESILYRITQKVPKGGLLHLHFNAELYPDLLMERARSMKNMYVRSIRPLLEEVDFKDTEMVFNVLDSAEVAPNVNIFSKEYPGNATNWKTPEMKWKVWMPWNKFQEEFVKLEFAKNYREQNPITKDNVTEATHCCSEPAHCPLEPAEIWLKSKMQLSPEEAYGPAQTVNGVWARFNQATRCFKGLLNYESVYKWYIGKAIDQMIAEKVMYAELRPMLLDKSIPKDDGKGIVDNFSQMKLIIEGVRLKKEELKNRGEGEKFPFGLKIIYCTPRSIPKKMMQEEMRHCLELKRDFPELICGFDLVGAEDRPNHIGFYKEELIAFQKTCEAVGRPIPFLFHAGETLLDTGGSTDPNNSNLYDAVLLKSKRIGHGFALMKHPQLVEKFKKTDTSPGICIELCPISNELLHLCRNIKEHPFPELLAAGIPCTVNSDNPSLFSNSMSHEFYQIMVGAPSMSLYSWKQLALWSIEYSCLNDPDKIKGRDILLQTWAVFCAEIVEEYGELLNGEDLDVTKAEKAYLKLTESP